MQYNIQYNTPIYINQNNPRNNGCCVGDFIVENYLYSPILRVQQHDQQNNQLRNNISPSSTIHYGAPVLEKTHINEKGQIETIVVKNGYTFFISFVDEPQDELAEDISKDWINYDEIPRPILEKISKDEEDNVTYKCKVCSEIVQTEAKLYSHAKNHLSCKLCDMHFNSLVEIKQHNLLVHHPVSNQHQQSSTNKPPPACQTEEPPPSLPTPPAPTPPPRTTTPSQRQQISLSNLIECIKCDIVFRDYLHFEKHLWDCHTVLDPGGMDGKAYACPFCESVLNWPSKLREHLTREHTSLRKHNCKDCRISFLFVPSYHRHNQKFHGKLN